MGKLINMTGVKCKNWEVLERATPPREQKSKTAWWLCKCLKCGKTKIFDGVEIRRGRIGECHCDYEYTSYHKKESTDKIHRRVINEVGNRYGKLVVDSFAYTKDGSAYWNCKCDCGNTTIVRGNHLRNYRVKSCGCMTSYKEQEIQKILQEYKINFKREYSFKDLKDSGLLRFDFAIFNQQSELVGLIEYQGRQHFSEPEKFNYYGLLQKHDAMKVEYCKNHYIPLLILDKESNLLVDILEWINKIGILE